MTATSTELDQLVSGGPRRRGSTNACVLSFTREHQSLPAEEEGDLAVNSLLEALHVGAVEGIALLMAVCVASHADVLSLCVTLGYVLCLANG